MRSVSTSWVCPIISPSSSANLKAPDAAEAWCNQKNFGGAYLTPAVSFHHLVGNSFFASSTMAPASPSPRQRRAIGMIATPS